MNKENENVGIESATILKDGRFAVGYSSGFSSGYNFIIIYDNETFEPNLKIEEKQSGYIC